ncbi:sulfotransferase family protein [Actibacterium sp. XHP0104]|uniref:sulfotransferase family protein n=1 Tax=Actibacterium sp. XHP0104 TaxID=2984335 RepID=UPI0021E6E075|nr:sulfotransferase family protein [Actibacterium sp. XHP0104]MCV2882903.1 sulfotransferase family protein [Actibacterium sp. XHP0104]
MIISRKRSFIFVHIPKTGGTSMALALESRAAADDILIGDTPKAQKRRHRLREAQTAGRLWKHSRLADVAGLIQPDEMAAFFVFTMVRNPWDRMVSYYHWARAQRFDHPAITLAQSLDFTGFLNHPHTRASLAADGAAGYVTAPDGHERCDAFVRLEHLETDLAPVEAHLGFRLNLPHVNRSARQGDYHGHYRPDDAALVADLCATDIARFGYRFD